MLSLTKILLIGATGKLGQSVLKEILLQQERYEVGLLVRNPQKLPVDTKAKIFTGDVLNNSIDSAIAWADVVINCSGIVSYHKRDKHKIRSVNVDGVKNIVKFCFKYDKPLIHSSSAIAYGSSEMPFLFSEDTVHNKDLKIYRGSYAESKHLADQIIIASGIHSIILRPGTMVSTLSKLYNFYAKGYIADLKGGASFALMDDVAKAYITAISLVQSQKSVHIFNLGGNNLTFSEVFSFFKTGTNKKPYIVSRQILSGLSIVNDYLLYPLLNKAIITRENYLTGNRFTYLDSSKAKQQLNYKISSFEQSLQNLLLEEGSNAAYGSAIHA